MTITYTGTAPEPTVLASDDLGGTVRAYTLRDGKTWMNLRSRECIIGRFESKNGTRLITWERGPLWKRILGTLRRAFSRSGNP